MPRPVTDRLGADGAEVPLPSRFERRKEEILNAAGALFNQHGLRDATLATIAAAIGLNLKSLRYYFERREDLVAAAFMRSITLHQGLAEEALAEVSIQARIRRFVRSYFVLHADVKLGRRPEFIHFGDLRALTAPQSDVVWPAYSGMFRSIRRLLQGPELLWDRAQLNACAHMVLSQLLWSVAWSDSYFPEDAPQIADRLSDVLLEGIASAQIDPSRFDALPPVSAAEGGHLSRQSFLRAATALINQQGYRGASVDRISAELNVTKGAFYHHNENRDSLVVACFEQSFGLMRGAQAEALAHEADGLSRVLAASVALVNRQMLDNATLLRTAAFMAVGPELRVKMAWEMSRLTLRFQDMLSDGQIDGSVRPCNVRIAAEMVTATINSAEELGRWVSTADVGNASRLYVRPLMVGLSAVASRR